MTKTVIEIETKTFLRFWLVILGMGLLVGFVTQAWSGILIVLIAAFLAIALQPLAKRIDRIGGSKERKSLSSVVAVIVVVLGVTLVLGLVGPVVVRETSKFLQHAPEEVGRFLGSVDIDGFGQSVGIEDLSTQLTTAVRNFSATLVENLSSFAFDSVGAIIGLVTSAIMVIVLTILFMLQGPELLERFWKRMENRSKAKGQAWQRLASRMAGVVAKYMSGQMLVALLDGTVVTVMVLILGLIFPAVDPGLAVPMGLLAVILYMVPMFGPVITTVVTALMLLFNSPWAAVVFVVIYMVYAQVENNVIAPKIQGKGLDLPPLLILIAIVVGTYAFGLIGTLAAIPVAGCIKVILEEYPNLKG